MARPAPLPPFHVHGRVTGSRFADRADEVRRVVGVLEEPGAKLLVRGRRRMGKTSILEVAQARAMHRGTPVLYADLSTAQTLPEAATRLLIAANTALGRQWHEVLLDIARRAAQAITVSFGDDGRPQLGLVPERFQSPAHAPQALDVVLDAINTTARARRRPLGIILDEFQELTTAGGQSVAWTLRGVIQRHDAVSYVCAGSRRRLLDALVGRDGAFFKMLDPPLDVGPIDPAFLAVWIDSRLSKFRVAPQPGVGARCVALAGPCTLDVMLLAREVYQRQAASRAATVASVDEAFAVLVTLLSDGLRHQWDETSPAQQQVLRAVAGASAGLTTGETTVAFGLGPSGSVMSAVRPLIEREVLVREPRESAVAAGYTFDSPFMRGWVIRHALPDLGLQRPITALPATRA